MDGFLDTLSTIHGGRTLSEIDTLLADLVHNVRSSGKKGSITVTLTVEPASKGNTDVLAVTDKVAVKAPNRERGAAIFYPQEDGSLSRRDTRQQDLDLRVVPETEPINFKEVAS